MKSKLLFENDQLIQAKLHLLPIVYAITNSLFIIENLLLLNYVINGINLGQGIIYDRVVLFYNIVILTLFIFVYILCPIFNSGSITTMYNNMKLVNLLVAGISKKDILLEKIKIGILNLCFCLISSLPLAYVSLLFGGVNVLKIFKVLLIVLMYIMIDTTLCVMISAFNKNIIISYLVSYLAGLIIVIPILLLLNLIINNNFAMMVFILISFVLSYVFYLISKRGKVFNL